MSISRWTDKAKCVADTGILFSVWKEKEILSYATAQMYLKYITKWNKPVTERQILYDTTYEAE
jgi:hypothetical protein